AELCQLPGGRGGKFKLPTLTELHQRLFDTPFSEAHNATADVEATGRCFLELIRLRHFTPQELEVSPEYFQDFDRANPRPMESIGLRHINLKEASNKIADALWAGDTGEISQKEIQQNLASLEDSPFAHLHNHSQFSVLQSTIDIQDLIGVTAKNGMPAVALTDHANMMGAFHFVSGILAHNKGVKQRNAEALENGGQPSEREIVPIVGCEFQVCEDHTNKNTKDNGYQIVLLAKNKKGYLNLAKMSSIAYTDGFYYVPRIDKGIVERYKDDIIALTGNLYGEVPNKILNV